MKFPRLAVSLLLICNSLFSVTAQAAMPAKDAAAFRSDLDWMLQTLPQRHANLYHATPRAEFEALGQRLRSELPAMSRGQAIVALSRVAALAHDGHTALFLLPFPGAAAIDGIRPLPLQLYDFDDGLRIVAIEAAHRDLLGARVSAIGGVPVKEAMRRVAELLPRDNAMGEREYDAWYLALAEVLQSLQLADGGHYRFTLETAQGRRELELKPMTVAPDAHWVDRFITLPGPRDAWVGAGDNAPTARWLARSGEPWWFEKLPSGDVYAQINLLRESPQKPFADYVDQVLASVPAEGRARLVLDLRLNRGGNGDLRWALVHALIRHPAFQQPGRLFVLIGRRTFSAAQLLANALEQHTPARFVGEPTGSSPNHYGELGQASLPATGLPLVYSMLYWQHDPRDARPWIPPHLAVSLTYADLAAGRDPVLRAALNSQPPPSVESVMALPLAKHDAAGAVAAMRGLEARFHNPWRNLFEKELNDLGYRLLGQKRAQDAVAVLGLAAEWYPQSYNAWDSLGEAWLAAGVRHRAAYCYARAVKLKPDYAYGIETLNRILATR